MTPQLLSCIIFEKFPSRLKREIIDVVGQNYPSLGYILDHYSDGKIMTYRTNVWLRSYVVNKGK